MTRKIEAIIESKLQEDETLLWVQQPNASLVGSYSTFFVFSAMGCLLCAIIPPIFNEFNKGKGLSEVNIFLLLFLGGYALVAFFMLLSPYIRYREATHTIYGVTSKRLMLYVNRYRGEKIVSLGKHEIRGLWIKEQGNGYGDLVFLPKTLSRNYQLMDVPLAFLSIQKPAEVRQLIIDTFGFDKDDFWQD